MAKHTCPVCGKYQFETWNDMDICDVCDWCNDGVQESEPDYRGGANRMSLNEAKKAYKEGRQIR
ncbi:MAG: CPCC family cysteine-rich protein [Megasphaera massiliensis]|nr:CPCC family cysteine-rich protein [Megasphaera massiliensis]